MLYHLLLSILYPLIVVTLIIEVLLLLGVGVALFAAAQYVHHLASSKRDVRSLS